MTDGEHKVRKPLKAQRASARARVGDALTSSSREADPEHLDTRWQECNAIMDAVYAAKEGPSVPHPSLSVRMTRAKQLTSRLPPALFSLDPLRRQRPSSRLIATGPSLLSF